MRTEDKEGPTLLYESKDEKAYRERECLLKFKEETENVRRPSPDGEILGFNRDSRRNNSQGAVRPMGRTGSVGDASILQGKSSEYRPSKAFRNVLENIYKIQFSDLNSKSKQGVYDRDNPDIRFSTVQEEDTPKKPKTPAYEGTGYCRQYFKINICGA